MADIKWRIRPHQGRGKQISRIKTTHLQEESCTQPYLGKKSYKFLAPYTFLRIKPFNLLNQRLLPEKVRNLSEQSFNLRTINLEYYEKEVIITDHQSFL